MEQADQPHIDEHRLNEYLDDTLSPDQRSEIEEHLADCAFCQSQASKLKALFVALDDLPETTMDRDLSPEVLETLRHRGLYWQAGRWLIALQVTLAISVLLFTRPLLLRQYAEIPLDEFNQWGQAYVQSVTQFVIQTWSDWMGVLDQAVQRGFEFTHLSTDSPWPGLNPWPWMGIFALAWLIGNSLLLWPSLKERLHSGREGNGFV